MLRIKDVNVFYGDIQALHNISMEINQGEIVALVGANAAGKTTTIQTISGINKCKSGSIEFMGERIDNKPPNKIVEMGVVQVPEGRKLFPFMTVLENLELGAYTPEARKHKKETLEMVFEMLPVLKERQKQLAGSLSGGQQQMCAIGRGLMARPKLIMFDEPSLGLAPILVQKTFEIIKKISEQGTTVLLVEQNVQHSLKMADKGYVLENGRIVLEGKGEDLLNNEYLKKAYLGI
ncbi:MAG: branched-chain amino acid transport system ATP-binding protein [Thermosediminibacterales bacterium]|nr:branched-chain amino acid transport system ATP-binding protein [Thermosediminibacterales bacterium]MDK2836539.1 branched-chain amino acid transport system ATP-binding protein [Thermosediminibacterales bacterium]